MLAPVIALVLACPPTADAAAAPRGEPFEIWYADPYGHIGYGRVAQHNLPIAPIDPPTAPDLPLWDLEATLAQLDAEHGSSATPEWASWMRWSIARAQRRPATAHAALVHALAADTLSAARLAWWRSLAPPTLDDRDALLLAYEAATAATTRVYLAAALALTQWELSCPVPLGPDGACRAPGVSIDDRRQALVRRDPIAIESARRWTALAKHLRRKARITPTDIAALALLAELELAAHTDDYEALLIAAPPSDQPSAKAMRAFEDTYARCRMAQHNLHRDLLDIEANLSARVLLREALHLHAHARLFDEHHQFEARAQRRRANEARKFAPWRLHTIASSLLDGAADLAEHCVAIGTDAELLAACESILVLDPPPLHELVPEPRSTSVVHSPGVVGPELL